MTRAAPTAEAYNRIFVYHIENSGQIILRELAECGPILPVELRARAQATLDFALHMSAVWNVTHALLRALSPGMEQLGLWDEWLPYLEHGLLICQERQDTPNKIQLGLALGRLQRLLADYPAAQHTFETVVEHANRVEDRRSAAIALHQLAYVARLQSQYAQAKSYVAQAQANLDAGDTESATGHWVLGTIAEFEKDWELALDHHSRALAIWQAVGNEQRTAWAMQNLGSTYWRMGRLTEAATHIRASIAVMDRTHDPVNHAISRMTLGIIYIHLDQPDEALALFTLAESVFREVGDLLHLAMAHNNLAVARRLQQAWQQAIQAAETSVRLWETLGGLHSLANTLGELGLAYQGAGQLAAAIAAFERGIVLLQQAATGPQTESLRVELTGFLESAKRQANESGSDSVADLSDPPVPGTSAADDDFVPAA